MVFLLEDAALFSLLFQNSFLFGPLYCFFCGILFPLLGGVWRILAACFIEDTVYPFPLACAPLGRNHKRFFLMLSYGFSWRQGDVDCVGASVTLSPPPVKDTWIRCFPCLVLSGRCSWRSLPFPLLITSLCVLPSNTFFGVPLLFVPLIFLFVPGKSSSL